MRLVSRTQAWRMMRGIAGGWPCEDDCSWDGAADAPRGGWPSNDGPSRHGAPRLRACRTAPEAQRQHRRYRTLGPANLEQSLQSRRDRAKLENLRRLPVCQAGNGVRWTVRDALVPSPDVRCRLKGRKRCQPVGRGCPYPGAGRSRRQSWPPLTRRKPSLRHPGCVRFPTPAPGRGQPRPDNATQSVAGCYSTAAACNQPSTLRHAAGASPRRVPSGSPRLDANPRRRGHHHPGAARHRPAGARDGPAGVQVA